MIKNGKYYLHTYNDIHNSKIYILHYPEKLIVGKGYCVLLVILKPKNLEISPSVSFLCWGLEGEGVLGGNHEANTVLSDQHTLRGVVQVVLETFLLLHHAQNKPN